MSEEREAVRDVGQPQPAGPAGADRRPVVPNPPRGDLRDVAVTTVMSHPVLAVVDDAGRCVGLLADRTVASEWAGRPMAFVRRAVASACGDGQPIVGCDATVAAAARMMRRCGTDAVIVVDAERRPLGILTGGDVIALLAKPDHERTSHTRP